MNKYLGEILKKILDATNSEEVKSIITEAKTLLEEDLLSDEEALVLTTHIMELKKKLNLFMETTPTKKHSMVEIRSVVKNAYAPPLKSKMDGLREFPKKNWLLHFKDPNPTIHTEKTYGLFNRTGFSMAKFKETDILIRYEQRKVGDFLADRGYRLESFPVYEHAICDIFSYRPLQSDKVGNDYLADCYGKIIPILGEPTYVVSANSLFGHAGNFYISYLKSVVWDVNQFLEENPDFIDSIFEQVQSEERQNQKRLTNE